MYDDVLTIYESNDDTPLVIDSPHSGRNFPSDFSTKVDALTLRRWEDCYVDELVGEAPSFGADLISMLIPRTYIDMNRHVLDVDPALVKGEMSMQIHPEQQTVELGRGLIKRIGPNGEEIHNKNLDEDDILQMIESYYIPYHLTLEEHLFKKKKNGNVYHLNMHAMYSKNAATGEPRADFVISDNHQKTCDPEFTNFVKKELEGLGYTVAVNDPFLGGEIVRMYGNPKHGVHSLQIEIKKSLYMSEDTFEKHEGFNKLQKDLSTFIGNVAKYVR